MAACDWPEEAAATAYGAYANGCVVGVVWCSACVGAAACAGVGLTLAMVLLAAAEDPFGTVRIPGGGRMPGGGRSVVDGITGCAVGGGVGVGASMVSGGCACGGDSVAGAGAGGVGGGARFSMVVVVVVGVFAG